LLKTAGINGSPSQAKSALEISLNPSKVPKVRQRQEEFSTIAQFIIANNPVGRSHTRVRLKYMLGP